MTYFFPAESREWGRHEKPGFGTGSSGYVSSLLLPLLKEGYNITAIDRVQAYTDIVSDIAAYDLRDKLSSDDNYIIIH